VSADNLQTTPKARPPTRGEVVVEDANPPKVKREEDAEEKQPIAEVRVEEKSPERKEKKAHPRVAENRERARSSGEARRRERSRSRRRTVAKDRRSPLPRRDRSGPGKDIEKVAPKEAEGEPHHTEAQEPARAPTASGGRLSSVAWDHFQPIIVEIRVIIRTEGQNLKTKE
jgi:hypothetical protein